MLSIEDLSLEGKLVFLRAELNTPIEPPTQKLTNLGRIQEACITVHDLSKSGVVIGSHHDYIPLAQHAEALNGMLGHKVILDEEIFGPTSLHDINFLYEGEVLLLDNLKFTADENIEYSPQDAAKTVLVQKLHKDFACVLDSFPTAHHAHPSIVGFSYLLPTCAGRLVSKELKALTRLTSSEKAPFTTVPGGERINGRLEAIDAWIANKRADKILLGGQIANLFLRATEKIEYDIGFDSEAEALERALLLLADYPDVSELPTDVAVARSEERIDVPINELGRKEKIFDIGSYAIERYFRIIRSSGTIFMSGPAGMFEDRRFRLGTELLLRSMASSFGMTIVSGGHLNAALQRILASENGLTTSALPDGHSYYV